MSFKLDRNKLDTCGFWIFGGQCDVTR